MQTSEKTSKCLAKASPAPTLAERIDAIEQFLQQLVQLLEVEPNLSRENVAAWMEVMTASAGAQGLQALRQRGALERLCERVLSPAVDVLRPANGWIS
ncbi:hypothetical protein ACSFBI_13805 [Variovorax sp. RB3P1]|uniref:hypothetical protein n=1 Tax=Variovorax sp. RB3P1 TaxID=3443732 RepID=UPI003F486AB0